MKLEDLQTTLSGLRKPWPDAWPGLPLVLAQSLDRMGWLAGTPLPATAQPVQACLMALAELIEHDGAARHAQGREPAYHNRLHMADALVALSFLLVESRKDAPQAVSQPSHFEWLAMLAMLGHDYMHDGSINRSPSELEIRSADLLAPLMMAHGLPAADQALVRHLVLMTDPIHVAAAHQKTVGRRFGLEDPDWLTVLVQESDILASSLPGVGEELTRQLAREWLLVDEPRARMVLTPAGRQGFLRFGALFSSPASKRLGIWDLRAAQLASLDTALSPEKIL